MDYDPLLGLPSLERASPIQHTRAEMVSPIKTPPRNWINRKRRRPITDSTSSVNKKIKLENTRIRPQKIHEPLPGYVKLRNDLANLEHYLGYLAVQFEKGEKRLRDAIGLLRNAKRELCEMHFPTTN